MILVENKKIRLRFTLLETYQAGLELMGSEVKALRSRLGNLEGARVVVRGGEAFLVGMTIPPYQAANTAESYDQERSRRLLLKRSEIAELLDAEGKKGLTVVPVELYTAGRHIKIRVAIVRGKAKVDKREDLKKTEAKREADRAMKGI